MEKRCQQFKSSRETLLEMDPITLNVVLKRLIPDKQFRFITFQENGFRYGNVTMLVYNYIPDIFIVCAESAVTLKRAMEELITLSPGVKWHYGAVNYFDACNGNDYCITGELRMISIPLCVNPNGKLVGKFPMDD